MNLKFSGPRLKPDLRSWNQLSPLGARHGREPFVLREEREEDPFADSLLGPFQNSQQEAHRVASKIILKSF